MPALLHPPDREAADDGSDLWCARCGTGPIDDLDAHTREHHPRLAPYGVTFEPCVDDLVDTIDPSPSDGRDRGGVVP